MYEESVEAIWNSDFGLSSNNWLIIHGFGVPHNKLWFLGGAIIYERHEVAVILRLGIISSMIEHFSCAFVLTKVDSVQDYFIFKVVFDDGLKVAVVFTLLGFRDDALEAC